jgi:DNA-binding protein HU-beta
MRISVSKLHFLEKLFKKKLFPYLCRPKNLGLEFFTKKLKRKNVTKADVIAEISEKTGLDKADVTTTVEAFFSVVKESMASGENIYVRGFGSFINKKRAKKVARNISKQESIVIDEHYVPSFKPSKMFIEKIRTSPKVNGNS